MNAYVYKVVQIWPGQTVTCLHTNRPGHIWTTLYLSHTVNVYHKSTQNPLVKYTGNIFHMQEKRPQLMMSCSANRRKRKI
jgi:hypothetical protein